MVVVREAERFKKSYAKLHKNFKMRVEKLVNKILKNPKIGKPMQFQRKGTREVYLKPFRLSYVYLENEDTIVLLDVYHKDEQ